MRLLLFMVAAAMLAVVAASLQPWSVAAQATPNRDGLKAMPAIKLSDFKGNAVAADQLKGHILVLDFWATWCGPCIAEIPFFNRLQEKYSEKGVKVIGVTMASGEASEVQPFVARHKMKYTILMGDDNQAFDFNLVGFPTTFIVTRDGKIYKRYVGTGPGKAEQMEADIQKLLGEQ